MTNKTVSPEAMKRRRAVYRFLKANPDKHLQREWCGTRQCVAGWTAELDGWKRTPESMDVAAESGAYHPDIFVEKEGMVEEIALVAQSLLELDDQQAWDLFYTSDALNSMSVLRRLCR